jgi:DNA-binding CsgD family transcriptional regulator
MSRSAHEDRAVRADLVSVDSALREEIMRRYLARSHCFDRYAATRRRLGFAPSDPEPEPARRRRVRPADGITPAELRALHLIASGFTDRQIAEEDGIPEVRVKAHARTLLRKLQAKNRPHAVATAVQRGLLSLDFLSEPQN